MERADRMSAVERCTTLAIKALLDERGKARYWDGVSSCPYATACTLAAMVELDERFDPAMRENAVAYLIATQRQNGAWSLGVAPGEQLPITAHCYTALSMYHAHFEKTGNKVLIEAIRRARAYLDRAFNFLQTFDVNVQHYLASIVAAHWLAKIYNIPLLPSALENHISKILADYEIWIAKSPEACVYRTPAEIVHLACRPEVSRLCELQTRQLENGSWNLQQIDSTSLALITIARQHGSEEVLRRGCNYLRSSQNADGGFPEFAPAELCNTIYVGFYFSDVCWRAGIALPTWLHNMQSWLYQSQNPDGSMSISRWSPGDGDIDDTAWAAYWLVKGLNEDLNTPQLHAARAFLEHAQNDDGGFPTWPGRPSAVDLTAHAYQGLLALGSDESILQKAAKYLRLRQFEDGSWSAMWNVSKIYGTTQVLMALADNYQSEPFFHSGVNYVLQSQGTDGLWDTAEETGMALYVLLLLDSSKYQAAIERGMEALVDTQHGGYWPEKCKWKGIFSYTTRPWALTPPIAACLAYCGKVLNGTNLNRLLDVS